jgi:sugar phosphate permease
VTLVTWRLPDADLALTVQGVTSWFVFYLIKEKGVADAAQAAVRVSGLELGGLVGSLIAGAEHNSR